MTACAAADATVLRQIKDVARKRPAYAGARILGPAGAMLGLLILRRKLQYNLPIELSGFRQQSE